MIKKAILGGVEYFLALNPDTILQPDAIEKILETIKKDEKIGAIAPKILKWNFTSNPNLPHPDPLLIKEREKIDSYCLFITSEHRFSDRKQGQIDPAEH